MISKHCITVFLIAAVLFLSGCGEETPDMAVIELAEVQNRTKGPLEMALLCPAEPVSLIDPIEVQLEMKLERGYTVELEEGQLTSGAGFLLRDKKQTVTSDPDFKYINYTLLLESFTAGELQLPALTAVFTAVDEPDIVYRLSTEPEIIHISGLSDEELAQLTLADISGVRELPAPPAVWPWYLLGIIPAAALIVLIIKLRPRREKVQKTLPYDEMALHRLRELEAKQYLQQGQFDVFYYEITWIIRQYISGRFGIHAPEQTSEEFLAAMDKHEAFPAEFKPALHAYLEHCDAVKYAGDIPETNISQDIFKQTREFIVETQDEGNG